MSVISLDPLSISCGTDTSNKLCIGNPIPSYSSCGCGGPCCSCADKIHGDGGIHLQTGDPQLIAADTTSPFFDQIRRFMPQACRSFNQGLGWNWLAWPTMSKQTYLGEEYIVIVLPSGQQYWISSEEVTGGGAPGGPGGGGSTSTSYACEFGGHGHFDMDATSGTATLCKEDGTKFVFNDFVQGVIAGAIKQIVSPGGDTITSYFDSNGFIEEFQRSVTVDSVTTIQSMAFSYNANDLVEYATYRTKVGAGSWSEHRRTSYTYYSSSDSHGSEGDLKTAEEQLPSGMSWATTHTTYYRYYKDGDTDGRDHLVQFVVGPEAFRRLDDAVADPFTATDAQVAAKADSEFKYDNLNRVVEAKHNAGNLTFSYTYTTRQNTSNPNHWKYKVVETVPNGAANVRYLNHIGQVIVSTFLDGVDSFVQSCQFNNDFNPTAHSHPSAFASLDSRHADLDITLKTSEGLIEVITYYTTTSGGGVEGHFKNRSVKNGTAASLKKIEEVEYATQTVGDCSVHPKSKVTTYRNDDGTGAISTSYAYTWHSGTLQMEQMKTTLPVISTAQHGSGTANERYERFDSNGRLIWSKDERGFITRHVYDEVTNSVVQLIQDVDTTQVSDEPSGWTTPSGGGKHIVTDMELDELGRVTQTLGPVHEVDISGTATDVRTASWTIHQEEDHEVWSAQGYATGASFDTFTLVNPVSIDKMDHAGRSIESIMATRASTSGKLLSTDTFAQSSYVRWSTSSYNDENQLENSRVYHTIPSSGSGSSGTNYEQSGFGYDAAGRQNRTTTPGGTITRQVFDAMNRAVETFVGLDDTGATDSDPTGGGATGNDMVIVSEHEYDNGNDGEDGYLTKSTQHIDSSTTRVTDFTYDWRGRRTVIDGEEESYAEMTYDNLGQVTRVDRKDTNSTGNLVGRSESVYDDLGRVYQSKVYAVDTSTGTVGDAMISRTWYNESGSVIKQQDPGSKRFTKQEYDSLGRQVKAFVGFDVDETTYAEAGNVTGDTIFEQSESDYDYAGNVIESRVRQRHHDATGTGELTTPSGSNPKARVSYVAHYSDPVGRGIAVANYGTNADTALSRTSTVPTASDTILVNETGYDDVGQAFKSIDPMGREDRVVFDDAGRVLKQIQNYTDGDPTTGDSDEDVTVEFTYTADGQQATLTAKQSSSSDDQTTTYVYGTTLSDSDVARSDLLRAVIYPDSDDVASPLGNGTDGVYDRVEHKYNRAGEQAEMKDQNGTVHTYEFDGLGRKIHDRVTTLASGIDGAVRRLSFTFDERGQLHKATSWDNANVGSGSVVNEVLREYNDMGLLDKEYQEHVGAKDANTLYVGYNYDDSSTSGEFTKGWRMTSMEYPNGRLVHYAHGASGSASDCLDRVSSIHDDDSGTPGYELVAIEYLGYNRVVQEDYGEPEVRYDLIGEVSGVYSGLDSFDRITIGRWINYNTTTDLLGREFGYDRASNPIWTEDLIETGRDEYLVHDQLHRLTQAQRGTLNASLTGISGTPVVEEQWTYDTVGNWLSYSRFESGTAVSSQGRSHDFGNQITGVTEAVLPTYHVPSYDRNGNTVSSPHGDLPSLLLDMVYDAWNRPVSSKTGSDDVGLYCYDALFRLVARSYDDTSPGSGTGLNRHSSRFFDVNWRMLEARVSESTISQPEAENPKYQWVWSNADFAELILRDSNNDSDNNCDDERHYFLTERCFGNRLLAVVSSSGSLVERYEYKAYGNRVVLSPDLQHVRSSSDYDIQYVGLGSFRHSETGAKDERFRFLNPLLGRYTTRDPLEFFPERYNIYEYVNSSPLRYVDPLGLLAIECTCLCGHTRRKSGSRKTIVEYETGDDINKLCGDSCSAFTTGHLYHCSFSGKHFHWKIVGSRDDVAIPADDLGCSRKASDWLNYTYDNCVGCCVKNWEAGAFLANWFGDVGEHHNKVVVPYTSARVPKEKALGLKKGFRLDLSRSAVARTEHVTVAATRNGSTTQKVFRTGNKAAIYLVIAEGAWDYGAIACCLGHCSKN